MLLVQKCSRCRRNQLILIAIIVPCIILYYISKYDGVFTERDLDLTRSSARKAAQAASYTSVNKTAVDKHAHKPPEDGVDYKNRNSIIAYIEKRLQDALKEDKGTGCHMPPLDPFANEVTQFDKDLPKVVCSGQDWVKCHLHKCRVVKEVLATTKNVKCSYRDIIYKSDSKYVIGDATEVEGGNPYVLKKSDHVKVICKGYKNSSLTDDNGNIIPSKWKGIAIGFRTLTPPDPVDEMGAIDVLIFGFDSTSKNGFIRRMPKSYRFLTEELGATVLNGYNIVGDGTPAALFPILTGKNELEHPDVRRSQNKNTFDVKTFMFHKMEMEGYRTAYFEDMPWIGTFQYRFNGFNRQPAQHYLRAFFQEEYASNRQLLNRNQYCVGDTPSYKLMMNITEQFFKLPGKHYAFTFIADITHNDFNMISTADDDTVDFLRALKDGGHFETTMLLFMGDHGPRFANVRNTLQGKLEERMPLMAIRLPAILKRSRPDAQVALEANANALTTPYDIYATINDALGLEKYQNLYKINGADLYRALSLLKQIPQNRSCSEAAIEPHWCACLTWENVSQSDELYNEAVNSFVDFINSLTEPVRSACTERWARRVWRVWRRRANSRLLAFQGARDADGYVGEFRRPTARYTEHYQIKVTVGPGNGIYEASAVYKDNKFTYTIRDVSRINAYNDEPSCISDTHPHLNMYCYCKR